MRRVKRLFVTLFVLTLLASIGIPARGENARDPYIPVKVESYTQGDLNEIRIMRTYQLSPVDDPAGSQPKILRTKVGHKNIAELTVISKVR